MSDENEKNNVCDNCEPKPKVPVTTIAVNWKKTLTAIAGVCVVLGFVLSFLPVPTALVTAIYYLAIFSGGIYVYYTSIGKIMQIYALKYPTKP